MAINRLVRLLVKNNFEFSFEWLDGEYYLVIILGNVEHIIHPSDYDRLAQLWDEIQTYWLN